jgi:hypothetical protein
MTEPKAPSHVFVCSNQRCTAVWDADPNGHCPACIQPSGVGYSTMRREVKALPSQKEPTNV